MAVKVTGQPSFVDALMPAAVAGQLDRLNGLVKWYRFEKIAGHLRDPGGPGRPGWPVLVLLKAVLLQSLYGLSERELEEALNDRLSFRRFVGLSLEMAAPDHAAARTTARAMEGTRRRTCRRATTRAPADTSRHRAPSAAPRPARRR